MQEKSGSSVRTIAADSRAPASDGRSYVSSNPGVRTAPRPVHRARSAEAPLTHGEGAEAGLGAYPRQQAFAGLTAIPPDFTVFVASDKDATSGHEVHKDPTA